MPEHPAHYRFYRPILWDNGEEWADCRYSTGATANIVKLCDEFFILTVNHVMDKTSQDWTVEDCRIPWRIRSEAYCKIGKGVNFSLPKDHENKLIADVCIHNLDGPSCPESPLEPGEYLDLEYLDFTDATFHDELLDNSKAEVASDLVAIRSSMKRGMAEATAIEVFAGERTKEWIKAHGVETSPS